MRSAIPTTIPKSAVCSAMYETFNAVASAVSLIRGSAGRSRPIALLVLGRLRLVVRPGRFPGRRRTGSGPSRRRSGRRRLERVDAHVLPKQRASEPDRSPLDLVAVREVNILEPASSTPAAMASGDMSCPPTIFSWLSSSTTSSTESQTASHRSSNASKAPRKPSGLVHGRTWDRTRDLPRVKRALSR